MAQSMVSRVVEDDATLHDVLPPGAKLKPRALRHVLTSFGNEELPKLMLKAAVRQRNPLPNACVAAIALHLLGENGKATGKLFSDVYKRMYRKTVAAHIKEHKLLDEAGCSPLLTEAFAGLRKRKVRDDEPLPRNALVAVLRGHHGWSFRGLSWSGHFREGAGEAGGDADLRQQVERACSELDAMQLGLLRAFFADVFSGPAREGRLEALRGACRPMWLHRAELLSRDFGRSYAALAAALIEDARDMRARRDAADGKYAMTVGRCTVGAASVPPMRVHVLLPGAGASAAATPWVAVVVRVDGEPWARPAAGRGDVVVREDGRVYATPAGRHALPFLDLLASGGVSSDVARLFDHCVLCGRHLVNGQSLEVMMGSTCARRAEGWSARIRHGYPRDAAVSAAVFAGGPAQLLRSALGAQLGEVCRRVAQRAGDDTPLATLAEFADGDVDEVLRLAARLVRGLARFDGAADAAVDRAVQEALLMEAERRFLPTRPLDALEAADALGLGNKAVRVRRELELARLLMDEPPLR